jgi:anti-anti-sigma regulatory factor/anti-sigma regulatory factor (Ser/Thr protein kinase)
VTAEVSQPISRLDNRIIVSGEFGITLFHRFLATLYTAIEKLGYQDLLLDFSQCTAAFPGPMLAVCSQVIEARERGVSVRLDLPIAIRLATLFRNANWAHLLDPERQERSRFKGSSHVPATNFASPSEQAQAVSSIIGVILSSLGQVDRADFAAIEWSLNEITDNVLTHSRAKRGGLVQVATFEKTRRRVEFVVCDAGAGIPRTLRETHPEITSDTHALERAVREGVTRDKSLGQGNGLFGSFEICRVSGGYFEVHSGYAHLGYDPRPRKGLSVRNEAIPYQGALVVSCVDCSRPGVLGEALKFEGTIHRPIDSVELKYENADGDGGSFLIRDECESTGNRPAGTPVRTKLRNLSNMLGGQKIVIDFDGVPLVSSSFADEVFAKLFVEMGAMRFMRSFEFKNASSTVQALIDRAIEQRTKDGMGIN